MPERVRTVGDLFSQFGGWLVGFMAVVGTIIYNSRKVQIDESTLVLGQWKNLVDTHQVEIRQLKEEFGIYKRDAMQEIASLRKRLGEVEQAFANYKLEAAQHIADRDLEIAGLKRAIAQNSQSTAYHFRRSAGQGAEDTDAVQRLDQAGDNSIPKGGKKR